MSICSTFAVLVLLVKMSTIMKFTCRKHFVMLDYFESQPENLWDTLLQERIKGAERDIVFFGESTQPVSKDVC